MFKPMLRSTAMRIDRTRCVHYELCYTVAPIIRNTLERIPITSERDPRGDGDVSGRRYRLA